MLVRGLAFHVIMKTLLFSIKSSLLKDNNIPSHSEQSLGRPVGMATCQLAAEFEFMAKLMKVKRRKVEPTILRRDIYFLSHKL